MPEQPPVPDYPTEFFDKLLRHITPDVVAGIASADHESDVHERAIWDLIRCLPITGRIDWYPREAFALTKWSEPEVQAMRRDNRQSVVDLHLERLFSCACLLVSYPFEQCHDTEPSDVLPRLVESTIAFDCGWLSTLRGLIVWLRDSCDRSDPAWFDCETDATLCRVAIAIIDAASGKTEGQAGFMREVDEIIDRKRRSFDRREERWTWLLEGNYFDQSVHIWKSLAERHLLKPPGHWTEDARAAAACLGQAIISDSSPAP